MEKLLVLWYGKIVWEWKYCRYFENEITSHTLRVKIVWEWKYCPYFESENSLRMKILPVLWEWCRFSAVLPTGHCVPPAPQCANAKHEFQKMQSCKIVERLCNWWQQKYFSHDTFRKKSIALSRRAHEWSFLFWDLIPFTLVSDAQWSQWHLLLCGRSR